MGQLLFTDPMTRALGDLTSIKYDILKYVNVLNSQPKKLKIIKLNVDLFSMSH